ncbi:hypothetical protein GH714_031457 [Hevea brasiliensis]|uniref:MLO-like protein n=1 Tax=Hevea brasiliensis TaxID=3981 RepID=A0A6A6NK53_HEVBR|nr:hypothetical protein GH714_031457 [Hevea brasiliensis]
MAEGGTTLEYTPTWVVAVVCTVFVVISLAVERFLHYLGKLLKKKNQKPLFEALQKIKEELMLLGFISLLLTVFQGRITSICISEKLADKWLPCKNKSDATGLPIFRPSSLSSLGKVPILSTTALHHLHIFIFVLACVHVVFCALTILFGSAKIRQWKHWEDSVSNKEYDIEEAKSSKVTHVHDHDFIKNRFRGIGKNFYLMGWVHSFFKQFYGSINKSDYITLRLGFIMTHCRGNPKFNFHKYMMRALEADFKKVVGISWYLWIFVVVFLLLNVAGWHAYFWIAFIPFILLLAVGTKLEHIIIQLAHEVQYGFDSCIMGEVGYIIPRLIIGAFIQFVCSYSTLPLYAIVTQMGSSFKKAIFDEHIQEGLVGWAKQAKKKTVLRKAANGSSQVGHKEDSPGAVLLTKIGSERSTTEERKAGEISQENYP